ncbi:MAG TPA: hypothetical protein VI197_15100 [Polyangiaceae bacterium]
MAVGFMVLALGVLVGLGGVTGCSGGDGSTQGSGDTAGTDGSGSTGSGGSSGSGGSVGSGATGANDSSESATTGAARREVMSCEEIETEIETTSASFDFPAEVTLGSWEGVPAELKVLPTGAELCGFIDLLNQGLIVSELGGPELEAYYRPIFDDLECPSLECEIQTEGDQEQYVCSCFGEDHYGTLTTAPHAAYYLLSYE